MNDKKMKFDVTGAVVANNAEIGVDNIETPFGNMKWVYLMQEGAIDGSMVIKGMDVGGLMLNGSLNSRIGAKGWYFKAAGQVEIPNLGGGAMYALDWKLYWHTEWRLGTRHRQLWLFADRVSKQGEWIFISRQC
jgi:hypothetical protein